MKKWRCIKGFIEDDETLWLTKGKIYKEDEYGFMVFDEGTRWILNKESNFEHVKIIGNYLIEIKEEDEKVREFKLGDRVRLVVDNWNNGLKGEVGTIVDVKRETHEGGLGIEFDNFTEGHSCNGSTKTKENSGWYYKSEDIYLISPNDNKSEKSIHITTDGTSTHAVLKGGKEIIKRAKVGLFHEDEYKFEAGVIEVVKKLLDVVDEKVEESKYKEVERYAKVGELVKVVTLEGHNAKIGTIARVVRVGNYGYLDIVVGRNSHCLNSRNYVVLEPIKNSSNMSDLSTFTDSELLDEIKRRMEK